MDPDYFKTADNCQMNGCFKTQAFSLSKEPQSLVEATGHPDKEGLGMNPIRCACGRFKGDLDLQGPIGFGSGGRIHRQAARLMSMSRVLGLPL